MADYTEVFGVHFRNQFIRAGGFHQDLFAELITVGFAMWKANILVPMEKFLW